MLHKSKREATPRTRRYTVASHLLLYHRTKKCLNALNSYILNDYYYLQNAFLIRIQRQNQKYLLISNNNLLPFDYNFFNLKPKGYGKQNL